MFCPMLVWRREELREGKVSGPGGARCFPDGRMMRIFSACLFKREVGKEQTVQKWGEETAWRTTTEQISLRLYFFTWWSLTYCLYRKLPQCDGILFLSSAGSHTLVCTHMHAHMKRHMRTQVPVHARTAGRWLEDVGKYSLHWGSNRGRVWVRVRLARDRVGSFNVAAGASLHRGVDLWL